MDRQKLAPTFQLSRNGVKNKLNHPIPIVGMKSFEEDLLVEMKWIFPPFFLNLAEDVTSAAVLVGWHKKILPINQGNLRQSHASTAETDCFRRSSYYPSMNYFFFHFQRPIFIANLGKNRCFLCRRLKFPEKIFKHFLSHVLLQKYRCGLGFCFCVGGSSCGAERKRK